MFANQYQAPTAEFGPDPHDRTSAGLMATIWNRLQGARTHPYAPMQGKDASITWNGTSAGAPQAFRGLNGAPLGGAVPYRNGESAMIDSGLVEGPMGDPARRIFAQRLARRSSIGGL
jgi:hypothetical protein